LYNENSIDNIGFLSPRHIFCKQQQFKNAINHIALGSIDDNNYSIISDVDIIFFPSFHQSVMTTLDIYPDVDIFFMSENEYQNLPNPGFIIVKHNKNVLDFLEKIIDVYITKDASQLINISSILLSMISQTQCKSAILDLRFMNNNYIADNRLYEHAACFHSTSLFNILDKAYNLNSILLESRNLFGFFTKEKGISSDKWHKLLKEKNNHAT